MKNTLVQLNNQFFTACVGDEAQLARKIELRLIQSKNNIENPENRLFAEPF